MSNKNMHAAKVFILASQIVQLLLLLFFLVSFFQIRNLSIEYQTLCDKCFSAS